jgi:hypothetical protein
MRPWKMIEGVARLRPVTPKGCTTLALVLLLTVTGCSAKSDFKEARSLDTPEAYEEFLDKHPDSKEYSSTAKKRLEELFFREAMKENTYEAYARFVKRFPYGPYAQKAQRAAEDIRADELGIHLYRTPPSDFYGWVDSRRLPYRILVRSLSPELAGTDYLERKWYVELVRRGLFVPMDPQKTYRVSPDLTLHVRESVIVLCVTPLALVDAEVRVRGTTIKRYKIAAGHIEKYLLYEVFKDHPLYDSLLRARRKNVQALNERFEKRLKKLPLEGSLAVEFDLPQQATESDQQMIREFVKYLKELPICETLFAYPRGRPSSRLFNQRLYLSIDQELHYPRASKGWSTAGSSVDWTDLNTKWILADREYFFKKMTLDLLDLLEASDAPPSRSRGLERKRPAPG